MNMHNADNLVAGLTEDHVVRITGLSKGQLRAWDRRGFFEPRHAYEDRAKAYSRIYSFKDVVGLKTISVLRKRYKISINQLEKVARGLAERGFDHWADTKLFVVNKKVHFQHPGTKRVEAVDDGQLAMLEVIDVIEDVKDRVLKLKERNTDHFGKIERHKYVARNSWVVSGTRIPTAAIRRFFEAGYSPSEIVKEYPTLTLNDIEAALQHEKGVAKAG